MKTVRDFLQSTARDDRGATLVEYSLLLSVIAAAVSFGLDYSLKQSAHGWAAIETAWIQPGGGAQGTSAIPGGAAQGQGPGGGQAGGSGNNPQGNNGWGNSGHDGGAKNPQTER